MADAGAAERFRSGLGKGEAEGSRRRDSASDVQRAGDQEPPGSGRSGRGKGAASGVSPAPDGMYRGFLPVPIIENWPFNPSTLGAGFDFGTLGAPPLVPVLLPPPFPTYYPIPGQEQQAHPGGIFAVPGMSMFGPMGGIPQGGFVPMSFNIPPGPPPVQVDGRAHAATALATRPIQVGQGAPQAEIRDAAAPEGLRQRYVGAAVRAPQGGPVPVEPQRQLQVVRRFQIGFQLDLLLMLKLAVVVIVFNQDGTKDRLMLLVFLAGIVYLYQTGALAPFLRWISLSAQRAMMPPQQPLPGANGAPNPEVAAVLPPNLRDAPLRPEARQEVPHEPPVQNGLVGQPEVPPTVGVDEQRVEQPPQNPNWWGIFKELQMFVVGFLTSLLPGFQHVE